MSLPDLSALAMHDTGPDDAGPLIPSDIVHSDDRYVLKLKAYAKSLPYSIESYSKMQDLLDFILLRIAQCVEAKDYDPGFLQFDSLLT
jgi:proteasome activator subunit 4